MVRNAAPAIIAQMAGQNRRRNVMGACEEKIATDNFAVSLKSEIESEIEFRKAYFYFLEMAMLISLVVCGKTDM